MAAGGRTAAAAALRGAAAAAAAPALLGWMLFWGWYPCPVAQRRQLRQRQQRARAWMEAPDARCSPLIVSPCLPISFPISALGQDSAREAPMP